MAKQLLKAALLISVFLLLTACVTSSTLETHAIGSDFTDCVGCPEMVVLPPGEYKMGSPDTEKDRREHEGPQRTVKIPSKFAIARFEVTRAQFADFIAETSHVPADNCAVWSGLRGGERLKEKNWLDPNFTQTDTDPVVCISWIDAKAYVAWLQEKTGRAYRLPSESEWEYAARAGTTSRYSFGDSLDVICEFGNVPDETAKRTAGGFYWKFVECDDGYGAETSPVGTFKPNAFGLYDMHANVWEWVEDCYHNSFEGGPVDGSAWVGDDCPARVVRGGSLSAPVDNSRSAARYSGTFEGRLKEQYDPEHYSNFNLGFRVALSLE